MDINHNHTHHFGHDLYHRLEQSALLPYMIAVALLCTLFTCPLSAQNTRTFVNGLHTLQVRPNGKWGEPPVMMMGGGNFVEISFDDMQHDYVRYTYTITHCDATWKSSGLYEGDYMTGINGAYPIEDYDQSMNTEMMYNHYHFRLPNENVRLLISGNYRVDIFEDGDDEPVATASFSLLEPKVGIDLTISPNTDIDSYKSHQQVSFNINYQTYSCTNPEMEFMPIVVQNSRWDTHVEGLKPTYLRTNQLMYEHEPRLIFEAGNEYRRFEMLDPYVAGMNVDRMEQDDDYFHAYIYPDVQRINYKYDQDQDGRYFIRNSDDFENDTESDYIFTHFFLKMPKLPGGRLYLHGELTENVFTEDNEMEYDIIEHQYELTLPLKQGSYNYQYLFVHDDETTGRSLPVEGSFHQTENEYYVYVYHRPFGGRYDKLVGFKSLKYKTN